MINVKNGGDHKLYVVSLAFNTLNTISISTGENFRGPCNYNCGRFKHTYFKSQL